jgi:hypothetical protein
MADVKKGDDMFDYTHDRVVGVVDSAREASATIAALSDAGFPDDEVEILYGLQGEESVDPDGEDHGLKGKVIRVGEKIMGPEPKHAERQHWGKFRSNNSGSKNCKQTHVHHDPRAKSANEHDSYLKRAFSC